MTVHTPLTTATLSYIASVFSLVVLRTPTQRCNKRFSPIGSHNNSRIPLRQNESKSKIHPGDSWWLMNDCLLCILLQC